MKIANFLWPVRRSPGETLFRGWNRGLGRSALAGFALGLGGGLFAADPESAPGRVPQAPPAPPPVIERFDAPSPPPIRPHGPTRYSIGDPTDEEQQYLEYINRARANPSAEGQRLFHTTDPEVRSAYTFFSVDLALMTNEFNAIAVTPPLSFHSALIAAARRHSGDMFTNQFQSHTGTDGSTPFTRMTNAGYIYNTAGENIYSYAESVFHGHAGFEVDWGFGGTGGMQSPRGHRNSIHNANFREVGIGVVLGINGSVGPQLVTQDFGSRGGITPLITGVAYYDLNLNGFYDVGEGISGITVDVAGSQFHAVTGTSGGYSVPVPGNGNFTATFSGPGLTDDARPVTISGNANLKLDFTPVYTPPAIAGPDQLAVGASGDFTFTAVGGASRYAWTQSALIPYTTTEGAETGAGNFIVSTSPGYTVADSQAAAGGSFSFHLAMPSPATDQTLELNRNLRVGAANPQLTFASRLGWATSNQVAEAHISLDGGRSWSQVWMRAGTGNGGQTGFEVVDVPLAAHANQTIRARFQYNHVGGSFFPQTTSGVGWYIDDIRFTDVEEQSSTVTNVVNAPGFAFSASAEGRYQLSVQPEISGRWFAAGPEKIVQVSGTVPPTVDVASIASTGSAQLAIECVVQNGPPVSIQLETKNDLSSSWSVMNGLQAQVITPGVRYRFDVPIGAAGQSFYRARIQP